jgi:deoxyribodipyrimidine photo-lyase
MRLSLRASRLYEAALDCAAFRVPPNRAMTEPSTQAAVDWHGFAPTAEAALQRLAAVRPHDYARSRNHLQGAVTGLSPYLTHGLLTLPQVLDAVQQAEVARGGKPLDGEHKFINELAWREYFHHVWRHEGKNIFASLHEGPLPDGAYARQVDAVIRAGATGVPAIDQAVRQLYATGWLHNHARMWLASYMVHVRKVHWRAAADWMYGHLIDGDLASNHLSWQWVAGTGSHKPYLFNAGNVARYAPEHWRTSRAAASASPRRRTWPPKRWRSPRCCTSRRSRSLRRRRRTCRARG